MTPNIVFEHSNIDHAVARRFDLRRLALCLPLMAVGLLPLACDVERAEDDAADERATEGEGSDGEATEGDDGGSGSAEPEDGGSGEQEPGIDSSEPCDDPECAPVRDPELDLLAEPDPAAGTACSGAVPHAHGNNLFPGSYEQTMGCDCAPGQNRDHYSSYNAGHGSCWALGWESPDPRDCRVRMQINRSGGFANGTCYAVIEQSPAGSCYSAQTNTGCNNPYITSCVCEKDSYCCNTQWDALCAWEVTSLGCG